MKVDEQGLRRLYQEHIRAQVPPSRLKCLSLDRLIHFLEGRLSKRAKYAVIDHVTSCASCYQEFIFLSQLRGYEERLTSQISGAPLATSYGISPFSVVCRQAAALVVLGLLLSVAFIFWQWKPQADERGKSSASLILLRPAGRSALVFPFEFCWKDKIPSREYIVELFDDSLRPLWKSDRVGRTSISFSAERVGLLVPGNTYFWMVTAYSFGISAMESDLQEFILARK